MIVRRLSLLLLFQKKILPQTKILAFKCPHPYLFLSMSSGFSLPLELLSFLHQKEVNHNQLQLLHEAVPWLDQLLLPRQLLVYALLLFFLLAITVSFAPISVHFVLVELAPSG